MELPQDTRAMTNGAGAAYTLVSFLGVDDLRTLPPQMVKTQILSPVHQDGPVMLAASDFNLTNANTDSVSIVAEIDGKIIKLTWHQLCSSIFTELCPASLFEPAPSCTRIYQAVLC
jgi:hypothetical protein